MPEGKIVTVLGANGAGKSTILKTISGIIDPSKGQVSFDGERDPGPRPGLDRARAASATCPRAARCSRCSRWRTTCAWAPTRAATRTASRSDIETVYGYFPILKERARQEAGQLSGGQQQMLAIARALLSRPKLMLMDEPSLGLSPLLTQEIFDIIVRINRERGTTILLVEQNAHMALEVADYGYVLEVGRIVMEDTCKRLAREGGHPRVLPRHEGRRRARAAPLEEEEAVEMSARSTRAADVLARRARRAARRPSCARRSSASGRP